MRRVSILLVTSAETKRWVIPKGNIGPASRRTPRGHEPTRKPCVLGAVCPTPLGSYRSASGGATALP